jgi:L-threonylcarbamoyladenylate synthase
MSVVARVISVVADPSGGDDIDLEAAVALVAEVLVAGGTVLIPTDTVYGLAVLASGIGGVEALARIKGRDPDKPVAVLVASPAQGLELFDRPGEALTRLASALWPGSLTLVAPAATGAPAPVVSASGTIGVRCPDHELVRRVAEAVGPLAVTSANPAGGEPLVRLGPLSALIEAWAALSEASLVVDGGPLHGTASTVVEVPAAAGGGSERSGDAVRSGSDGPRVLRNGPISAAAIGDLWRGSVK